MALNHSPEFNFEPKTQCNTAFWYPEGHHLSKLKRATKQCSIPNFKHLSQVILRQNFVSIFSYVLLMFEPWTPWCGAILDPGTLV